MPESHVNDHGVQFVKFPSMSCVSIVAGGVGGLLYEKRNGAIYIPFQDAFGNIMGYWDTNGVIVAEYTYDAFGKTIAQSGSMADVFRHRFSTKYYDSETGFYYYGYRYYFPELRRWLSRDPLEEEGGENLYAFSANSPIYNIDFLGGKIVVIKHIPGEEPLGGWSNSGALADTVYKSTSYITAEYKCAEGKIGFKVQIIEPVVMVHVYMTKKVDPLFLMHFENDHVHNAKRHDAAIWKYKYDLESVCVCPCEARRRQQELEQSLVDITRKIKEDNDTLDSENGPHKIDWVPGVKR